MTATNTPVAVAEVQPYIFFYGRCEEALEFYKGVFGGSYEAMYVKDTPMAKEMPPEAGGSIMHASFTAPGAKFFASDGMQTKAIDPEEGNIAIAVSATEAAEGERLVKALSDGGTLKMPLDAAFWGGRFASIVDRFGIEWMLTSP